MMDFTPNDEQRLIADGFARAFSDQGSPAQAENGEAWTTLEELGLLAATYPEERGGIAAGVGDMVHALLECGRAASSEPILGAAILPGLALTRAGAAAPDVPAGRLCIALGADTLTEADGALDGALSVVPGADVADAVLVVLPGDRLAVLSMAANGLTCDSYRLVDGRGAADLHLVQVRPEGIDAAVPGLADWLQDASAAAFAADALGAMLALREMTQTYLKERKQFGRPLGTFQALQHAMVDIYHDTEQFTSLVHLAARTCDGTDDQMRRRAVSATKHYLGGRIRRAAAEAVQLHGGIGVTEEYALGHYIKRVLVADMLNGSADMHGTRLARLIAEETRAGTAAAQRQEKVA